MKPQNQRRIRAAEEKPASRTGGFRERTITPTELAGAMASIATEALTFRKVWIKRQLDPGFRETLMLAVARFNDAKYCSWAHHEWALIEGVRGEELAHVERMEPAHLDRKRWIAICFVRELVAAKFGRVSKKRMKEMRDLYTREEIEEITLVAKVMDVLNRSSNTFEAFVSRLNGMPSRKGGVIDEAILSAVFCCALPPLFTFFSRSSKLSIDELTRRMIDYSREMEAERARTQRARGRKQRARA
jgi:AhpD family alkylhydroperoxidase